MVTTLYLHAASSTVSGTLPSTDQSSRTAARSIDAQTINRTMDTTIGTAQTSVTGTSANANDEIVYLTKFVSLPLNQTSVAANTWSYNFAYRLQNTTNQTAPVKEGATNPKFSNLPITCYVWRPSTGAKVSNIYDQDTPGTTNEYHDCAQTGAGNQEQVQDGTFSGSGVTCQVGDVIILEAWCYDTDITNRTTGVNYFYDGATVNTTNEATVSDQASFLETPETLTFTGGGGGGIDMTESASLTYANKFITKV